MAGLYLHIPFCKKACHYCDFHFSTSLKNKSLFLKMLCRELVMRKSEFRSEEVATIYFGGGTPSLLETDEIDMLLATIRDHYKVCQKVEITLEANPDDLTLEKIKSLSKTAINRLSIGVQSFSDRELKMMNRAHTATQVKQSLELATQYFDKISIDLMYGIPGLTAQEWRGNIREALSYAITHISSYALTVEKGTALHHFIKEKKYPEVDENLARIHFDILVEELVKAGFEHYEISNFAQPKHHSQHNTSYWLGKPYLGFGPSAHSYKDHKRSWNIANNAQYIKKLQVNELPSTAEVLTIKDQYNEYIMTGLRTIWGVSLVKIEQNFGPDALTYLQKEIQPFLQQEMVCIKDSYLKTTSKGKFLVDGIASDLFWI